MAVKLFHMWTGLNDKGAMWNLRLEHLKTTGLELAPKVVTDTFSHINNMLIQQDFNPEKELQV